MAPLKYFEIKAPCFQRKRLKLEMIVGARAVKPSQEAVK